MKKIIVAMMIVVLAVCSIAVFAGCQSYDYTIGVSQYERHVALDSSYEGFKSKLTELIEADGKTVNFIYNNASGDTANATTTAENLVTRKVDLIFAIATPSAIAAKAAAADAGIPIVYTAVTSPEEAKLVADNTTGTTDLNNIEKQVELMCQLVDGATKFGILYTNSEPNSVTQFKMAEACMEAKGITVVDGGISEIDNVEQMFNSFKSQGVQAIYIPTDNKLAGAAKTVNVMNKSTKCNLPIVCGEGNMNDLCGIATYGVDYKAIGERAAYMAYDIITGKKSAKDIPYENPESFELSLNEKIAEEIGFTIPQAVKDLLK
ncbi:MAG: ABC transporter substrate-binding protein [Clostridia bacterium]|nr:ABC transporter substrate-binding protein [Clostridia bacterium]